MFKRYAAVFGVICALTTATAVAQAQTLNDAGKLTLQTSGFATGFEPDSSDGFEFHGVTISGNTVDVTEATVKDKAMLEGEHALRVGGNLYQSLIRLSAQTRQSLLGRRVEVKVWYKANGTSAQVNLRWSSGDEERFIQRGDFRAIVALGYIRFLPTGKATDDGWIELSSGPVDWALGGVLAPDWISISDPQYIRSPVSNTPDYDPKSTALIDALEIIDLGPATVPDAACRATTEQDVCGDMGVCLMGRCADAAAVLGAPPVGKLREDYLTRRYEELNIFGAIRQGRQQLPAIRQVFDDLSDASPKVFWSSLSSAHQLFIDGHGSPPRNETFDFYNTLGVCLGPGEADLLPGATPGEMVPMVFEPGDGNPLGLQAGDVITKIDDLSVDEWISKNGRLFYNNNDVDGHKMTNITNLLRVTMKTGSALTFSRCSEPEGCAAEQVQEVKVDMAQVVGATFWSDQIIGGFYSYQVCDLRFKPVVTRGRQEDFYTFARWADRDGVRHLVFNGFPSPYDSTQGRNWAQTMDSGLNTNAQSLVIDQRTGYGGQIVSLVLMVGHLLDVTNRATSIFVPWFGEAFTGDLPQLAKSCSDQAQGSNELCGNYFSVEPTALQSTGGGANTRLALINGYDVSGNDYFARFIRFRKGPTRLFGYGPTVGAYGVSCQFPSYIGELRPMAYQCHDTLFAVGDEASVDGFESGYGVEPDEVIYQKQSDALVGKDTIVEAATTWAAQPGQGQ